jgi:hypothetical protein
MGKIKNVKQSIPVTSEYVSLLPSLASITTPRGRESISFFARTRLVGGSQKILTHFILIDGSFL